MALIDALREQYPMYDNKPDEVLIEAYRSKYHPDKTVAQLETSYAQKMEQEEADRRQKIKDETGFLGSVGRGLYRGTKQSYSLIADLLPALAGDIVGAEEFRDRNIKEYLEREETLNKEAPSIVPTYKDIDGFGDAALYAGESLGQLAPSIVTSLLGGGVGGFIGKEVAKKKAVDLAQDMAEEQAKKFITKQTRKGQLQGIVGGSFIGSGVQTVPEAYGSLLEVTDDPNAAVALGVGIFNASLDSILPAGIASKLSKEGRDEVARGLFARFMIEGGKGAVVEGLTEGTQEANQVIVAELYKDPSVREFFSDENLERIFDAGLRGAIGGKVFSGTTAAITGESPASREAREKTERDQQLGQDITTVRTDIEQGGRELVEQSMAGQPDPRTLLPAPAIDPQLDAVTQQIANIRADNTLTDEQKAEQLKPLIDRRDAAMNRESQGEPRRKIYDTGAGQVSLTDGEVISWANQNRGLDPLLGDIVDNSGITTERKADEIGKLLPRIVSRRQQEQSSPAVEVQEQKPAPAEIPQPVIAKFEKFRQAQDRQAAEQASDNAPKKAALKGAVTRTNRELGEAIKQFLGPDATQQQEIDVRTQLEQMSRVKPETDTTPAPIPAPAQPAATPAPAETPVQTEPAPQKLGQTEWVNSVKGLNQNQKATLTQAINERNFKVFDQYYDEGLITDSEYEQAFDTMPEVQSLEETNQGGTWKTQTVSAYDPRNPSRRQDKAPEKFGYETTYPLIEVNDGQSSRYLMYDPDKYTNESIPTGWQEVDKFGEYVQGSEVNSLLEGLKKSDQKKAVNILREDMGVQRGDPDSLQQLVDEGVISEEVALNSIRASAATGQQQQTTATEQTQERPRIPREEVQAAKDRIAARIDELRQQGKQGERIANTLEQAITDRSLTVNQVIVAFDAAKILNEILPQNADHTVKFMDKLFADAAVAEASGGTGTQVAGLNTRRTSERVNGMIQLALGLDAETVRSTAAHEAFHTLQDYFSAYDKGAEAILNAHFGQPGRIVTPSKTRAAKLLKKLAPNLYAQIQDRQMTAGELAAYTFQAYDQARRAGRSVPSMGGAVKRFFNFVSKFLPRLFNAMRGRGFRNLGDVMRDVSTGRTAQRFDQRGFETPVMEEQEVADRASVVLGVNSLDGDRISTRFPAGAKAQEDPLAETLQVGIEQIVDNPKVLAKTAALIRDYNALSKKELRGGDRLIVEKFINRLADNLVFIFDGIDANFRERSKRWYLGANKIANSFAKRFGVPPRVVAAVMAATSPQKDWFMNVSLAERIIDIKTNKADFTFTPEMMETANKIFGAAKYKDMLDYISGKTGRNDTSLGSLQMLEDQPIYQAMWIRIYDETYNDRSHQVVSPEGDFMGVAKTKNGQPKKTGWGSLNEIAKAVDAMDRPQDISAGMGFKNKIRSFFNNIIAPNSQSGDVTIDTHAVAAALLKPLSSISIEVDHNFGSTSVKGRPGTANSKNTGVQGLYGVYAEAYRRAADRRGVLAREMQSITWEAVRGLFTPSFKAQESNVAKIENIWNRFKNGSIDIDTAREEVLNEAGRFKAPEWAGPYSGTAETSGTASNTEELSGLGVPGRDTEAVDSGTGSGTTGRASAVLNVNRAAARPQSIGQTGGMADLLARGDEKGIIERIGTPFFRYFKSNRWIDDLVNRFQPLAELDKLDNAGKLKKANEGAFQFAELATNASGRAEFALLHGNLTYNPQTGELDVDPTSEGLLSIFKNIGSGQRYREFQMYALARRAVTLKQDGQRRVALLEQKLATAKKKREKKQIQAQIDKLKERQVNLDKLFTQERISDGLRYESAEFRDVFDRYNAFNQKTLQFLVDTGVISEAQRDGMSIDYIPYYKMMEEEEYGTKKGMFRNSILGPRTTQVFNNPDAGIRELTGREGTIGDLYENVIKNNQAMISAGLKNVSMGRALQAMERLEMAKKTPEALGKNSDFVVTYYENGQKVYMDLTDDNGVITDFNHRVFMALSAFSPPQLTGLMDMVQKITGVFRDAITLAPNFMIANLIRGDIAGYATVDAKFVPIIGGIKGFKNVISNDRVSNEMKAIAGVGGYSYGQDTRDFAKVFKDKMNPEWNAAKILPKVISGLKTVGEASELATRDTIYRAVLRETGSKTEAAYQALNLVNFNRKGNPQTRTGQILSLFLPMVPFLNARIQGLYRTGTALKGAEANRKRVIMRMAMLGGISMAIYFANKDDERWDDEPLYRKMANDIIYIGDYRILIPKAFEVGALAQTLPQVIAEFASGDEDMGYVADAAAHTFLNTFSFNPIPQVVKPVLEVYTNYDFFRGRDIESARMRNLPKDQRYSVTTPEVVRQLGSVTSAVGVSPAQLETLVRGYLGTLGMSFIAGTDTVLSEAGLIPEKPEGIMPFADAIGVSRFIREGADPANRWVGELYDLRREANEIYSGIRALREEGKREAAMELMKDNRQLLGQRKQINKMAKTISELTKQINKIRSSDKLDAATKKQRLNTLIARRNKIAENVERILDRIGK